MQTSTVASRVSERLRSLKLNAAEASRLAGLKRTFVHDLVSGRKKSVTAPALIALARALSCTPEYLAGETDITTRRMGGIPIAGVTEAGTWRETGLVPPTAAIAPEHIDIPKDATLFLNRGHGADRLGIPDGALIIVTEAQTSKALPGDTVVVKRRRGDLVEMSIRKVVAGDDGPCAVVFSTKIKPDPLPLHGDSGGKDFEVLGKVAAVVILFADRLA